MERFVGIWAAAPPGAGQLAMYMFYPFAHLLDFPPCSTLLGRYRGKLLIFEWYRVNREEFLDLQGT
jgi:hypothetical protein